MATILQRLTRALSPTVVREIAKTADLEPALASRGMTAAGSVMVLALADKAALRNGPAAVFRMLPTAGSPMRSELAFVARAGVPGAVLAPVLGARARAVGDRLDGALGFRASSLLPVATAVVLGLTARIVDEQDLHEAGLAELLALEATELRTAKGPVARLIRDSLAADHQAAVVRARYSQEPVTADESNRFRNGRTRADAAVAIHEALATISRMSPSDVPRFRRLVEDVASCVAGVSQAIGVPPDRGDRHSHRGGARR